MSSKEVNSIIINNLMRYDPLRIGLFGSYVRGERSKISDIDILVRFRETHSLLQLIRMENELSELLGIKVDLVTEGAVKNPRIRRSIDLDLQIIFEA
jgi:predicted nucleotidyltransferase